MRWRVLAPSEPDLLEELAALHVPLNDHDHIERWSTAAGSNIVTYEGNGVLRESEHLQYISVQPFIDPTMTVTVFVWLADLPATREQALADIREVYALTE